MGKTLEELKAEIAEAEKQAQEKVAEEKRHQEILSSLGEVKEVMTELKEKTLTVEVANQKEFPQDIKVSNLGDIAIPDAVKVTNLGDIHIPEPAKEVGIKQPTWFTLKGITDALTSLKTTIIKATDFDFDKFTKKKNALAVRLVTQDGKDYYNAGGNGAYEAGLTEQEALNLEAIRTNTGLLLLNGLPTQEVAFGMANADAFGRFRVSTPTTLFDSKQIFDNQPLFWDDAQTSGGGTSSTHSVNTASTTIGVALNTEGTRVRQTFQSWNYQPGKSQLINMTFVLDKTGGGAGITRRIGQFNTGNGLFLEDLEGVIRFVRRTSTSGVVVDNGVTQASWNIDKMDGTGVSGVNLDFSKTQILFFDYEWLGVGTVRMGFVVGGAIYYAHMFSNTNNLSEVYMSTPNLPLRYEISNSGAGVASTLEHICCSVMSEGGVEENGILRHKDSGAVSNLAAGTTYALIGLKLKSTHLGATIKIENISALASTQNDQVHWELKLNPTVAGVFTYADETNSALQTAVGAVANTVTGGTEVDGGYFSTNLPPTITVPNARKLGASIGGTPDTFILCVRPITNNITCQASITWRELS